jgi:hypothetical protein
MEMGVREPGIDQVGVFKIFSCKIRSDACLAIGFEPRAVILKDFPQIFTRDPVPAP